MSIWKPLGILGKETAKAEYGTIKMAHEVMGLISMKEKNQLCL